jgi:hypothetical protein
MLKSDQPSRRRLRKFATLTAAIGGALALVLGTGTNAFATSYTYPFATATPDWSCGTASATATVELVLQCDGNLVLYQVSTGKALWASGTAGHGVTRVDFSATMGAVVLYKGSSKYCAVGAWYQDPVTFRPSGSKALGGYARVQDDGNFVIYNVNNSAVWASNTNGGRQGSIHGCVQYY